MSRFMRALVAALMTALAAPTVTWTDAGADAGTDAYQSGNYAAARTAWEKASYRDPYAAYNLGTLFETGKGGEADYKLAFKWYNEAARNARGDQLKALKRKAVLALTRLVIKNRDHDFYATASMYMSTLAMKTGEPEALRMRGLLNEFMGDYSIENNIANADNPMRFSWALLRTAADRGSKRAAKEASRVWAKIEDKKSAKGFIKLVNDELKRNGVK
ncbi:MAG: SEL1-like repeat protein [Magnetovibrio sp.]|nr:SEL1-like repeat protein [Magnetovibrio sp.]